MTEEITLAQLAAEIAQLRRQLETVNQRLDMIYGAVSRLADQAPPAGTAPSSPPSGPQPGAGPSPMEIMSPGSMIDALRQRAIQLGLDVSDEAVERLKQQSEAETGSDEERPENK
ncbi:MAG: hypothetical protein ACE5H9_20580 [Anaerolineae bacterium]